MGEFWGYVTPKYWYRGQWYEGQEHLGGNTQRIGTSSYHWLLFCRQLVVYRIDDSAKQLSFWRVFELPESLPRGQVERLVWIMSFLRKHVGQGGDRSPVVLADKEALKRWPCLWEYLTTTSWPEGGGKRATATITLFLGPQALGACLNDKENERSCFANAGSILGLLDALEAVARNEDTVWKADREKTGGSARKKS